MIIYLNNYYMFNREILIGQTPQELFFKNLIVSVFIFILQIFDII